MPQLRLTQKFAKDLHIKVLPEPAVTTSIFDDWIVDVIRVQRKKVAVMVHVKSYMPFFIPYASIGGAKQVASSLGFLLSEWLVAHGLSEYCKLVGDLFRTPAIFCKTFDKKALGHMNDYKRCAPFAWQDIRFEEIDWSAQTSELSVMPIFLTKRHATTSTELMMKLIEDNEYA